MEEFLLLQGGPPREFPADVTRLRRTYGRPHSDWLAFMSQQWRVSSNAIVVR